jgi:hypothetical protein
VSQKGAGGQHDSFLTSTNFKDTSMTRTTFMVRKVSYACLAALIMASSANAGVILGLLKDPATTAGVATSTRSGAGTWQLYAIEDAAAADQGISLYSVTMGANINAINHRSPFGSATNGDGDPAPFGFSGNGLRSATNANPIASSQPLFNPAAPQTSIQIPGFGRTTGSANAAVLAYDPAMTGITSTSGATWGAYSSPVLASSAALLANNPGATNIAQALDAGRKFVFLAEGTYTGSLLASSVVDGVFSVFTNVQTGTSAAGTYGGTQLLVEVPEPATFALLGLAMVGGFGFVRRRS